MDNREIRLASRPAGLPTMENFEFAETEVPKPGADEVLVKLRYLSVDPYLRGRMRPGRSYVEPFAVGQVIVSTGVGEVVESRSPNFKNGDVVTGMFGWRLYDAVKAGGLMKVLPGFPETAALGVLGITGLTAYFGLLDIGAPKAGETVVVSGAAGAVGITTCQIAKLKGCRVVGIAGGPEKSEYLRNEIGVDATVDYKASNVGEALKAACPNGIDVYFDNVGGEVSDATLPSLNNGARIVLCGQISMYNNEKPDVGVRPQPFVLINRALMKGFIITDYMPRFGQAIGELAGWLAAGQLKHAETIVEGFDNTPRAFISLFEGANLGKQIVKI